MKKSLLTFAPALALAAVIAVPVAGASSGLTIDTPGLGTPIGKSVIFGGYASVPPGGNAGGATDGSKCSGPTTVMFTDGSGQTGYAPISDTSQGSLKLTGTRWSLPINLGTDLVTQSGNTKVALQAGKLTITVQSQAAGCEATVTYNYQPSQTVAAETTPTATPTPTPTPTLTPSASASPATAAATNTISPLMVFLIGALLGAALLSLAEVSAVSYLKKHGKKPQK